MSRAPHGTTYIPDAGFDEGDQYPPQSGQNQASHAASNFVDGSGLIFSMYMSMATEEDKKMAENWKADADGILIFTGLFSAAVASLISVSIQDIRPNPQDISNFYLANIYQTTVDPNISTSLPTSPPPFSPPNYAVWVNSLWFMSLVISLTCALLATLLQQWARRYLKVTQSRYSPHKRARIRAFFAEGVDKFLLPWAVETLPALLHISLFLFFAGLVVFLHNVDITIFKMVLSWVGLCTALYGSITLMPVFRLDSPYYTSLSSSAWFIVSGICCLASQLRWLLVWSACYPRPFFGFGTRWYKRLVHGMQKTIEKAALARRAEIDTRAFMWTFDSLDEDHELERFFSGLPGFRSSDEVDDPLPDLFMGSKQKLSEALIGLFDRTLSSDLLPEHVKNRRAIVCAKALDPGQFPDAFWDTLDEVISRDGLQTAELVRIMRGRDSDRDQETALLGEALFSNAITKVIARTQRRDGSWLISAPDKLGIPEADLQHLAADGDSSSLSNLNHLIRHQYNHSGKSSWSMTRFSKILEAASEFNVQDTSLHLQHEFCTLWNQCVLKAQNNSNQWMAYAVLRPICNVYITLHEGTDSAPTRFSASTSDGDSIIWDPSAYPLCNVAGHIHDDSAPTISASPDLPSPPVPAPLRVDESLLTVPPQPDDAIYVPGSFHAVHQTTTQSLRISVTPPGQAITDAIPDTIPSGVTKLRPTPETSTSTSAPPLSSNSPPTDVALQHNADLLAPSGSPNRPSSSSHPNLDNTLPAEFHRSTIVPTIPSTSTGLASAPNLGTATAEDDGSPQPSLCKEEDALGSP